MNRNITVIFLSLFLASGAQAETLLEIYEQAKRSDPAINEAEANMMAQMEAKPQARALLLPQLDASAGLDKTKSEGSSLQPANVGGEFVFANIDSERDVDGSNWSVDLDQTLFNVDQWRKLKRADKEVARAKADYDFAQQDLIIRVSEAYFDVLASQDQLASERAAKDAIGRQLEQAERRFEVGLIAITDVKEAQAGYDDSVALEIAAQRALATAKEGLREITGEYPQVLAAPAEEFPLIPPEPQIEQDWVDVSLQQNLALESARIGADITRSNVSIAKGGHYPTLGLFASYGNNQQEGDTTVFNDGPLGDQTNQIDTDNDSARVGIQFRLPIYSGGGVSSQVQEQVYLHRAARENFEKVARQTERETRDAYLGVIAEIARVQALARSEDSNQTALEATEAGYDVGTRTTVDVLNARQSLFLAQTQYARSKYDYLINVLRLKRAAGTLRAVDVGEINSWLVVQETLPATPGRGATPDVEIQPGTPTSGAMLELEKEREAAEAGKDSVE